MPEKMPALEKEKLLPKEIWEKNCSLPLDLEKVPTPDVIKEVMPTVEELFEEYKKLAEVMKVVSLDLDIIRHGETAHNLERRFTGTADVGLTAKGEEQAKKAGQDIKAKGKSYDLIIKSGLRRTDATANLALAEAGLDLKNLAMVTDSRINERCFGEHANKHQDDFEPDEKAKGYSYGRQFPGGENYSMVIGKLIWFLNDLFKAAQDFQDQSNRPMRGLLSGHGGTLRMLLGILNEVKDREEIRKSTVANAQVIEYPSQKFYNWAQFISNEELQASIDKH